MNIGEKIRQLRLKTGLSPEKLGLKVGISGLYIRRLENGERFSITLHTAEKLAKGLRVPVSALIDHEGLSEDLMPNPMAALAEVQEAIKAYVPVYGEVSAGQGMEPIDYVATTRARRAPENIIALRVRGLCLEPEVREGDTLIVDKNLSPRNGDLVVVLIDGQASVKRYVERPVEGVRDTDLPLNYLENSQGIYRPEDVLMIGVVTEFNRKRR